MLPTLIRNHFTSLSILNKQASPQAAPPPPPRLPQLPLCALTNKKIHVHLCAGLFFLNPGGCRQADAGTSLRTRTSTMHHAGTNLRTRGRMSWKFGHAHHSRRACSYAKNDQSRPPVLSEALKKMPKIDSSVAAEGVAHNVGGGCHRMMPFVRWEETTCIFRTCSKNVREARA